MEKNQNPLLFSLNSLTPALQELPIVKAKLKQQELYQTKHPEWVNAGSLRLLRAKMVMLQGVEKALQIVPPSKHNAKVFAPAVSYKFGKNTGEELEERLGGIPDLSDFIAWSLRNAQNSNKGLDPAKAIQHCWPVDGYDGQPLPFIGQLTAGCWQMAWHSLVSEGFDGMIYSPLRWSSASSESDAAEQKFIWAPTAWKGPHPCYNARILSWNPPDGQMRQKEWVIPQAEIRQATKEFVEANQIQTLPVHELIQPTFHLEVIDRNLRNKLEKKDPLFQSHGEVTLFGQGASQQGVRIPFGTSPAGLRMHPFITWNDFEHDTTHQIYMEAEPHLGFWTYGKMDSSCT